MCDTICVLPNASKCNSTILAKNSDRDPNEPHVIRYIDACDHAPDSRVQCTYIDIPQVTHTYAVMLFKPDWIWGAEMGVNEHGVAIGNEAVFTKARKGADALLGMDLLRLALERGDTAESALEIIIELLQMYGQGGNCGYSHDFRYDNSFLIVDKTKGYQLETSGKNYAVKEIVDKGAISNGLSIATDYVRAHGVAEGEDFTRKYRDPIYTHFAKSKARRSQSCHAMKNGKLDVGDMLSALRFHPEHLEGQEFARGEVGSVCMHGGGLVGDHTTGSFVVVLRQDAPMTIWATGASTPCLSAFKPLFFGIDSGGPIFDDESKGKDYWVKREQIHRAVIAGKVDAEEVRRKRNEMESKWLEQEAKLIASEPSAEQLQEFAMQAAKEEQAMVDALWIQEWDKLKGHRRYIRYWRQKNAELGKGR